MVSMTGHLFLRVRCSDIRSKILVNYSIIKKQRPKRDTSHDSPIGWRNYERTSSFTSKFDNHIFYDLSPFSLAGMKNGCMIDDA